MIFIQTDDYKDFAQWLKISEKTRPNTIKQYVYHLCKLKSMLDYNSIDITDAKNVNSFLMSATASKSFKLMATAALRKYYVSVGRKDLVMLIDRPKYTQKEAKKFIDEKTLNILIRSCRKRKDKLLLMMLFDTACRKEELLNIQPQHVDINKREISIIGKGGKQRYVKFTKATGELLKPYLKTSKKIFSEYNSLSLWKKLKSIAKNAGLEEVSLWISPHKFRHGWATEARRKGLSLGFIRRYLGHSSITTTDKFYSHIPTPDMTIKYDEAFK